MPIVAADIPVSTTPPTPAELASATARLKSVAHSHRAILDRARETDQPIYEAHPRFCDALALSAVDHPADHPTSDAPASGLATRGPNVSRIG